MSTEEYFDNEWEFDSGESFLPQGKEVRFRKYEKNHEKYWDEEYEGRKERKRPRWRDIEERLERNGISHLSRRPVNEIHRFLRNRVKFKF